MTSPENLASATARAGEHLGVNGLASISLWSTRFALTVSAVGFVTRLRVRSSCMEIGHKPVASGKEFSSERRR